MSAIDNIIAQIFNASKNINTTVSPGVQKDERNEEKCIQYHQNGWQHDGFDYTENSSDIIIYWKKGDKRNAVLLNTTEQRRWVKYISAQIKAGGF